MTIQTSAEDLKYNVWVGCLACYNEGKLVGEWFPGSEAPTSVEEWEDTVGYPKSHKTAGYPHEELWVFDHENSPVDGEYSPSTAVEYGQILDTLEEHEREPFAAWLDNHNVRTLDSDAVTSFRDEYRGTYESVFDFLWECYADMELPDWAEPHRGAIVRNIKGDWEQGGGWTSSSSIEPGSLHIFDQ